MIQDKRPVAVPIFSTKHDVKEVDRQALLLSIQTVTPNHEKRVRAIQVSSCIDRLSRVKLSQER